MSNSTRRTGDKRANSKIYRLQALCNHQADIIKEHEATIARLRQAVIDVGGGLGSVDMGEYQATWQAGHEKELVEK